MTIFYSPEKAGFYDDALKSSYEASGSWPDDAIELTSKQASLLYDSINKGCRIYQNGNAFSFSEPCPDKYHVWDEINNIWILTGTAAQQKKQDSITAAEDERKHRISSAMQAISLLQLKLQAGRELSDKDMLRLNATLDYIDDVNAVDSSTAPDITWPVIPEIN